MFESLLRMYLINAEKTIRALVPDRAVAGRVLRLRHDDLCDAWATGEDAEDAAKDAIARTRLPASIKADALKRAETLQNYWDTRCQYSLGCDSPATTTIETRVFGTVPCCDSCQKFYTAA